MIDGKRIPAYSKDKVVSLSDIAIFTPDTEVPLAEVFEKVKAKENGAKCSVDAKLITMAITKIYGRNSS